jgi:hypothetical protein
MGGETTTTLTEVNQMSILNGNLNEDTQKHCTACPDPGGHRICYDSWNRHYKAKYEIIKQYQQSIKFIRQSKSNAGLPGMPGLPRSPGYHGCTDFKQSIQKLDQDYKVKYDIEENDRILYPW